MVGIAGVCVAVFFVQRIASVGKRISSETKSNLGKVLRFAIKCLEKIFEANLQLGYYRSRSVFQSRLFWAW